MLSNLSIKDLEKVINQTKNTVDAIANFYKRELQCYEVLALENPNEFEEKRKECLTKCSNLNQKAFNMTIGELEVQLVSLESTEASLKSLEEKADTVAKILILENQELEKWCQYLIWCRFSMRIRHQAKWNTQLPPRLALQEQRKSLEALYERGLTISDKQRNCFNILALSKHPQLVDLALVFNSFHKASMNRTLPLRMPVPFNPVVSFPGLENDAYSTPVDLNVLLERDREHQETYLDRITMNYAAHFTNKAKQQLKALPSDEATELETQLSDAYFNATASIASTSQGSSSCSDDCSHPYKNYGIETFVPMIEKIDFVHTQELNLAREMHGLFAATKAQDLPMVAVSSNGVDIILSYRK